MTNRPPREIKYDGKRLVKCSGEPVIVRGRTFDTYVPHCETTEPDELDDEAIYERCRETGAVYRTR